MNKSIIKHLAKEIDKILNEDAEALYEFGRPDFKPLIKRLNLNRQTLLDYLAQAERYDEIHKRYSYHDDMKMDYWYNICVSIHCIFMTGELNS